LGIVGRARGGSGEGLGVEVGKVAGGKKREKRG
jgi:hypothetical protein